MILRNRNARSVPPRAALVAVALTACLGIAGSAGAGIVHIAVAQRGAAEYGAGYTVGRGTECFIVTPFHVVQFAGADAITVTDTKGSSAKARLLKGSEEFDAALLQIVGGHALDCPADWSDGATAVATISGAPFLVARKVDDNGRIMQTRFFPASTSRELVEIQPFGPNDELREGDSGSALYAGDQLVGMIVSVDTESREAVALTQSQIHGLFGADVLPQSQRRALVQGITYRNSENAYATVAAREFLAGANVALVAAGPDGTPAPGTEFVLAGRIVDVTTARTANPNYKAPERAAGDDDSIGRQLFRNLQQRMAEQVDEALDRNSDARYLVTYNVDVQVEVVKLADNSKIVNLERRSYEFAERDGATAADMEKTAVTNAVKEALALTLEKYPL
jgi:hypothetical protein